MPAEVHKLSFLHILQALYWLSGLSIGLERSLCLLRCRSC